MLDAGVLVDDNNGEIEYDTSRACCVLNCTTGRSQPRCCWSRAKRGVETRAESFR